MVKGWNSLGCLDHTIERSVMKLWNDAKVKESFEKGKKVVTSFTHNCGLSLIRPRTVFSSSVCKRE
jgi:hypothetical protein